VLILAVGLIVGLWVRSRRRSPHPSWDAEVQRAVTDLRWVQNELVPSVLRAPSSGEFAQIWTDGRPRLVAADQRVYGLAEKAPDPDHAAALDQLRASLEALTGDLDIEAHLAETATVDMFRAARAAVEQSLTEFSAALDAVDVRTSSASAPGPGHER
jgi:hypothetical protein